MISSKSPTNGTSDSTECPTSYLMRQTGTSRRFDSLSIMRIFQASEMPFHYGELWPILLRGIGALPWKSTSPDAARPPARLAPSAPNQRSPPAKRALGRRTREGRGQGHTVRPVLGCVLFELVTNTGFANQHTTQPTYSPDRSFIIRRPLYLRRPRHPAPLCRPLPPSSTGSDRPASHSLAASGFS